MAFSFSWEPSPSNRGPSLSLNHTMGATPSPGMEASHPSSTTNPNSGQQFEAEPAYGLPAPNERLSLTPAVALALSPTSRTYSLLWSLAPYPRQDRPEPWQLSLAGERQEPNAATSPVDHSLKLRFATLF